MRPGAARQRAVQRPGSLVRGARKRAARALAMAVGTGLLAVVAGLALPSAPAPAASRLAAAERPGGEQDLARVLVFRLEGPVSPINARALARAIQRAEQGGYRALIIEIDTPGGLEVSMREMVKHMLASRVPIITWVTPGGARAASAGVFVVMAGDVAAMAPGTNMGAATPVNLQAPMDSAMSQKATNDAAAFARTVAAQRGRNVEWAEQAVRRAVAARDSEAVALGIVDFEAATLAELLARADGLTWRRGEERHTLRTRGLPADRLEPGFGQRVLALIADPNVAYILLLLGFYGLLFELQNPGAILPGVVGGICLILAFLAFSALPVNYAGVALITLAVVFFLAEIKVASHGLLAAGGVVALVLGSLILFEGGGSGPRLSWSIIAGATISTTFFFLVLVAAGLRAQRRRVTTGARGLVGTRAVVTERLAPQGRVRIGDEYWNAVSSAPLEPGTEVEITGVDGLLLHVRSLPREAES